MRSRSEKYWSECAPALSKESSCVSFLQSMRDKYMLMAGLTKNAEYNALAQKTKEETVPGRQWGYMSESLAEEILRLYYEKNLYKLNIKEMLGISYKQVENVIERKHPVMKNVPRHYKEFL